MAANYLPRTVQGPTWFWMACNGEISYDKIPFYEVDWNNAVQFPFNNKTEKEVGPEHVYGIGLEACARKFSLAAQEFSPEAQKLSFDEQGSKPTDI
jgi:hypothetical protein